jgi:aspartyl-tRNA(Asn)/glutamyl-tRNA(Gln) amidotransferase subunit A
VDPADLTLEEAASLLAARELSSRELVESCLRRADELDPLLGTFACRADEAALAAADAADRLFAAGTVLGPLQGVPLGVKDVLSTADMPTRAQSRALPADWVAPGDAPSVARLRRAGAVLVGKTTTMESAFGVPDAAQGFRIPRNPWSLEHWSGGSSSGTANGVAAGLFLGGLGTDTGGSIRLPSAFCGTTGLKPTRGLVPLDGCIPLAPSLDSVGPMARTARGCALLLEALTGRPAAPPLRSLAGVSLAIEREHHAAAPGVDPGAARAFESAVELLAELGAATTGISLPQYGATVAAAQVVLLREAYTLHRENLRERWHDYGAPTRQRLVHGAFLGADDETRARELLRAAGAAVEELLVRHDAIVCLTAGGDPELVAALGVESHLAASSLTFTRVWNALGEPAVSIPIGFTSNGLPVGMQIVGRKGGDGPLLALASALQLATRARLGHPRGAPSTARGSTAPGGRNELDTSE